MTTVRYISNDGWQGFEQGKIYEVDFDYYMVNGDSWFVFKEGSPFHHNVSHRSGYVVNEHKKNFQVIKNA